MRGHTGHRAAGCDLPIQLAPMGSVSATAALPLAVAAAGGHGMYPALGLPPAALAPVLDALAARRGVRRQLRRADDRPRLARARDRARALRRLLPRRRPTRRWSRGARGGAVCGWQVESGEEARAAEAAGCDVVIAKGWESGGRKRIEGPALLPLLDAVLDAVALPVDRGRRDRDRARGRRGLAAGADGVRVGTRFIAAEESEAHPAWVAGGDRRRRRRRGRQHARSTSGMPEPGPHRVLRRSIEAAEALTERAGRRGADGRRGDPGPALRRRSRRRASRPGRSRRCRSTPASRPARSTRDPARRRDRRRAGGGRARAVDRRSGGATSTFA